MRKQARGQSRAGPRRRGGIYIAVLGCSMILTIVGMAGLAAVRVQRAATDAAAGLVEARTIADAGIELALMEITKDTNWRTNRKHGVWVENLAVGSGTVTIEGLDPDDGDLNDSPHDPIVLRSTGVRGDARHIVEVTLVADPVPLDILKSVLHSGGGLKVGSGAKVLAGGALVSANGQLDNSGTIDGSIEVRSVKKLGTVTGSQTTNAALKTMPPSGLAETYAAAGVQINVSGTLEKAVLAPGSNPWGAANPNGVYVIRTNSDLVIRNCRIHGTLVVICPGRTVQVERSVLMHPSRTDYPTLLVDGDLVLQHDSAPLTESDTKTNLNPPGAPYEDAVDSDTTDVYPSELVGLIHATGAITFDSTGVIRGAVISGSSGSTGGVEWGGGATLQYDEELFKNPPVGYTKSSSMSLDPGSWRRAVLE